MNIHKKNIFQFVVYCFLLLSIKACDLNLRLSPFPVSPIKTAARFSPTHHFGAIGEPIPPRNDVRTLPWERKMPQAIPKARFDEYKRLLREIKLKYNKPPRKEILRIANQFGLHPQQVKNALDCIC